MKNQPITLTPQELNEIKDNERFKVIVMEHLKQMLGIPEKVTKLETKVALILWSIPIIAVIAGIVIQVMK